MEKPTAITMAMQAAPQVNVASMGAKQEQANASKSPTKAAEDTYGGSAELRSYSVPASRTKGEGKFDLYVPPFALDTVISGVGMIPKLGWGFSALHGLGLRLAGFRRNSYDAGTGLSVLAGIGDDVLSNKFIKTLSQWAGKALDAVTAVQYINDWFFTHNYQIQEAIYNQFDRDIWISDS